MTKIRLVHPDAELVVELLDNPFVRKWVDHLGYMIDNYERDVHFANRPYVNKLDQLAIDSAERLSTVVGQLRQQNLPFAKFDVAELDSLDLSLQHKLNDLHRTFTNHAKLDLPQELLDLVHQVNMEVHNIESYVTTPHKVEMRYLSSQPYHELEVIFKCLKDGSQMLDESWLDIDQEHFEYLSDDVNIDVWLPDNILGKSYHQAYYDHDDPTAWDVTHHLGYNGSFAIGLEGNRATEHAKEQIQQWIRSYGITPGPSTCGMPLGHVVSGRNEFINLSKTVDSVLDNVIIEII
jgi:hypothetical protein